MSNLNWPESATHYGAETLQFNPGFYKKDGNTWLFMSEYFAPNGCWNRANKDDDPSRYIERPSEQSKPWSGPEDGLPPIGTVCEFNDSCGGQWHKVEVMYVSKHTILIKFFGGELEDVEGAYSPEESVCFRPIKPSAQLRETAIRELMDIAQVDCRVTAARLVDAGFKREAV